MDTLITISLTFIILISLSVCEHNSIDYPSTNAEVFDSVEREPLPTQESSSSEATQTSFESDSSDESRPAYTREDYDEMRKSLPYNPFEIDYDSEYNQNGYLEIDKTAGILEKYIEKALMGLLEVREIPDILKDNDLIFQTAGFCTNAFNSNANPLIKNTGVWFSATPKEHLDMTAKYIFGEECVIDYEEQSRIFKDPNPSQHIAYYGYAEEFGLALRYNLMKNGLVPTVLDYQDMGDYFQVTVVFLRWGGMIPPPSAWSFPYELYYYDETVQNKEDQYTYLNKENAKEFCFSDKPVKYSLRIDKGEGDKLYLRSVLLESHE